MKTNKNKISASEQFQKDILASMNRYYHKTLSENAKRAWLKRKGLSTPKICLVKNCKV